MRIKSGFPAILSILVVIACEKNDNSGTSVSDVPANTETPAYAPVSINTDKANYSPGEEVLFTIDRTTLPETVKVRYKHLNVPVSEEPVASASWKWKPPSEDFQGYMVEIYSVSGNIETVHATTAVDVSSTWKKFPRYGFLSKYPKMTDDEINQIIGSLNNYHINGLQFYDWHNKHHKPLPVEGNIPVNTWKDIINRDIYFATIERYIKAAHDKNMKVMFYNLIYGAWESGEADGLLKEWYVFTDNTHNNKDFHPLSSPFLSNIYLLDPSNTGWQQYLFGEIRKVYQYLAFDGFHIDQLGERKPRYNYEGALLSLSLTFQPFITALKNEEPRKDLVMNAVSQYGQQGIAASPVDFLYTEVWSPFDTYYDLSNLIKQNNTLSLNTKNTVLAAYMNYDLANRQGYFNTPSVLMTNAVIFAFGGAHLELGEHMLGKEYFPNNNLSMKEDLKTSLVEYYDFLVAYENLLRNGGTFNTVSLNSTDDKVKFGIWPATDGKVAVFGKLVDNRQVIHLINFTNSQTQSWRDNRGIQSEPLLIRDAKLNLISEKTIREIWLATPDIIGGTSRTLNFNQKGNKVSFILPELKYWDMLVIEY